MNFGPHIFTLVESTRSVLQDANHLWIKVQKRRRYCEKGAKKQKTPTFARTEIVRSKIRLTLKNNAHFFGN